MYHYTAHSLFPGPVWRFLSFWFRRTCNWPSAPARPTLNLTCSRLVLTDKDTRCREAQNLIEDTTHPEKDTRTPSTHPDTLGRPKLNQSKLEPLPFSTPLGILPRLPPKTPSSTPSACQTKQVVAESWKKKKRNFQLILAFSLASRSNQVGSTFFPGQCQ